MMTQQEIQTVFLEMQQLVKNSDALLVIFSQSALLVDQDASSLKKALDGGEKSLFNYLNQALSNRPYTDLESFKLVSGLVGLFDRLVTLYETEGQKQYREVVLTLAWMMADLDAHLDMIYENASLTDLIAKIAGDTSQLTVYDGAAGMARVVHAMAPKQAVLREINPQTATISYALCQLAEIEVDFHLQDSLTVNEPSHQVDLVVSTPPFGMRIPARLAADNDYLKMFNFGNNIPTSASDSLWIQQALFQLNNDGRAILQLAPGWFFRGGYDGNVRRWLIDNNLIEAIIYLPENIHTHTGIASCILILNKQKEGSNIRLIDARGLADSHKRTSKAVLTAASNQFIAELLTGDKKDETYCKDVTLKEIHERNYELVVNAYFTQALDVASWDLDQELKALDRYQTAYDKAREEFNQLLNSL